MIRSGLRPSKTGPRPPFSPPIRRSSLDLDAVEVERPLLVGADEGIGITSRVKPGGVDVDDRQRGQAERAVLEPAAGDDEHRVGVLDAGDVGLLAVEDEAAVALARARS